MGNAGRGNAQLCVWVGAVAGKSKQRSASQSGHTQTSHITGKGCTSVAGGQIPQAAQKALILVTQSYLAQSQWHHKPQSSKKKMFASSGTNSVD